MAQTTDHAGAARTGEAGDRLADEAVLDRLPIIQRAAAVAARRYRLAGADAAEVAGEAVARLYAAVTDRPDEAGAILSPAYIGRVAGAAAQAVRRATGAAMPVADVADVTDRAPKDTGDEATLRAHYRRVARIGIPKRTDVAGVADASRWEMRATGDRYEREAHADALAAAIARTGLDVSLLDGAPDEAPARRGWRRLARPVAHPMADDGRLSDRPGWAREAVAEAAPVRAGDVADVLLSHYRPQLVRRRTVRDEAGEVVARPGEVYRHRSVNLAAATGGDRTEYYRARRAVARWAGDVTREAARWADVPRTGEVASTIPAWHPAVTGEAVRQAAPAILPTDRPDVWQAREAAPVAHSPAWRAMLHAVEATHRRTALHGRLAGTGDPRDWWAVAGTA